MSYECDDHGEYSGLKCPGCQQEEEAQELLEAQEEANRLNRELIDEVAESTQRESDNAKKILKAIGDAAHKQNNPGQHRCPLCGGLGLNYRFPVCMICKRESADSKHWDKFDEEQRLIKEKEAAEKKAAAEKAERAAAEKARLEKAAAEKALAERIRREQEFRYEAQRRRIFKFFSIIIAIPIIGFIFSLFLIFKDSIPFPDFPKSESIEERVKKQNESNPKKAFSGVVSNPSTPTPREPTEKNPSTPTPIAIEPIRITVSLDLGGSGLLEIKEHFTREIDIDTIPDPQNILNLSERSLDIGECNGYPMPEYERGIAKLFFFKVPKDFYVSEYILDQIYKELELEPDPVALTLFNERNPDFSSLYPNMVQWTRADDPRDSRDNSTLQIPQLSTGLGSRHLKFRTGKDKGKYKEPAYDRSIFCGYFTLGWAYKYDGIEWWYAGRKKQTVTEPENGLPEPPLDEPAEKVLPDAIDPPK